MFKFRKGGNLPRPPLHFNKIIFQIRLDIATECLKRLSFHDIFIISVASASLGGGATDDP